MRLERGTSANGERKAWFVDRENARCVTVWGATHEICEAALRRHEWFRA